MTCRISEDEHGNLKFECGPAAKPKDHECDLKGPTVEITEGNSTVYSASCSICGKPAYDPWSIW